MLDACAHCFDVLARIVDEAALRFDHASIDYGPGRPACMVAGSEARSASIHLADGHMIKIERISHTYGQEDEARVAEKYGAAIADAGHPGESIAGRIEWFHGVARGMFTLDGRHIFVAFLFRRGSLVGTVQLEPEDQPDKYLMIDGLVQRVVETDADEVILTSEVWTAKAVDASHPDAGLRAGLRSDRREGLVLGG